MTKKYEFTGKTITHYDHTLHRIRALRDIPRLGVNAGDIGGWVEDHKNLSHDGDCWVYGEAKVYSKAEVSGNAEVYGEAKVCGNAEVYGEAEVFCEAIVCGNAAVYGEAKVFGDAKVSGNAEVYGKAEVSGNADIYGNAMVYGKAYIYEDVVVCGEAIVCDNADIYGDATIYGNAVASRKASIYGEAKVCGHAQVYDKTSITPINIIGLRWPITITDNKMSIGCETHSHAMWEISSDREIAEMSGRDALRFWHEHKDMLLALCERHAAKANK